MLLFTAGYRKPKKINHQAAQGQQGTKNTKEEKKEGRKKATKQNLCALRAPDPADLWSDGSLVVYYSSFLFAWGCE